MFFVYFSTNLRDDKTIQFRIPWAPYKHTQFCYINIVIAIILKAMYISIARSSAGVSVCVCVEVLTQTNSFTKVGIPIS